MYLLNYEEVATQLESQGLLKLFSDQRQALHEDLILKLDAQYLINLGLKVDVDSHLLVVFQQEQFNYYEINIKNPIGSGEESAIYQGRNIKTREIVAQKTSDYGSPAYRGWKIAAEKLNSFPYFVKSYAMGQLCLPEFSENTVTIACIDPSSIFVSGYLIMEFIPNAISETMLSLRARFWDEMTVSTFMQHLLNAFEMFAQEKIAGFDDAPANILIDQNNIPKLCDFNQLSQVQDNTEVERLSQWAYARAANTLLYIYRNLIQHEQSLLSGNEESPTRKKILALRSWIKNEGNQQRPFMLSRTLVNNKFDEVIQACETLKTKLNLRIELPPSGVLGVETSITTMGTLETVAHQRKLLWVEEPLQISSAASRNKPFRILTSMFGLFSGIQQGVKGVLKSISERAVSSKPESFQTETETETRKKITGIAPEKYSTFHSAVCEPQPFSDKLVVAQYGIYWLRKLSPLTLPWNRLHSFTVEEQQTLEATRHKIQALEKSFKEKLNCRAAQFPPIADNYKEVEGLINRVKKAYEQTLKLEKVSDSLMSEIVNNTIKAKKMLNHLTHPDLERALKKFEKRQIIKQQRLNRRQGKYFN